MKRFGLFTLIMLCLAACGGENTATTPQASASPPPFGSSLLTSDDNFLIAVSGAVTLNIPPGTGWARPIAGVNRPDHIRLVFTDDANTWQVSVWIPAETAPATTLSITSGSPAAIPLATLVSLAPDGTATVGPFTEQINGTVTIDAISDTAISGAFTFGAVSANDPSDTVTVQGIFADLPMSQ